MKIRHTVAILTLLLTSAFTQVALASVDVCVLNRTVNSAMAQGNVHASFKDGVVTLIGRADTILDSKHAERAALKFDGVTRVRNRIIVDD